MNPKQKIFFEVASQFIDHFVTRHHFAENKPLNTEEWFSLDKMHLALLFAEVFKAGATHTPIERDSTKSF